LYLVVEHFCAIRGSEVVTSGYRYAVENPDGREVIAYHWHPSAKVSEPHLHLGSGALGANKDLANIHVPREITLSDLLWLVREIRSATTP